jgi:hypothetical protein
MGLKDIIPEKDKLLMMDYIIYWKWNDWGPASVNLEIDLLETLVEPSAIAMREATTRISEVIRNQSK